MPETFIANNRYLRNVLDSIPFLVFILDTDLRIMDANSTARKLLGKELDLILKRLCGEVLHCIHEFESFEYCGHTEFCKDCVLREAVTESSRTMTTFRQKCKMIHLKNGKDQVVDYSVTASPIKYRDRTLILMVLEDITELLALRQLVTICSYCSRIRNEEGGWEKIHEYLKRKDNILCSHGMCPSCFEAQRNEASSISSLLST